MDAVTVGIDFGTLSGRAVVVSVADGRELGSAVHQYSRGVIDERLPSGRVLPPLWALQDPADWRAVLATAVPEALDASGVDPARVVGVGVDATSCTVLPVSADGGPLCEVAVFADRPHAWPKLWKHHAAQDQADRINALAASEGEPWLTRYGGAQSAEWQLAKGLQILEEDPNVYAAMTLLVEAADWIVWQLCGEFVRNACSDPARLVFTAAPGAARVLGMSDLGDRFRLVLNEIDVVPPDEPLVSLPVAHAVWEPRPSFTVATEGWLYAGGPHHTVLTSAVPTSTLRHFADMTGIELVVIDESSTVDDVRDRLRWNAAYYRLRQGL